MRQASATSRDQHRSGLLEFPHALPLARHPVIVGSDSSPGALGAHQRRGRWVLMSCLSGSADCVPLQRAERRLHASKGGSEIQRGGERVSVG